MIEKFDIEEIKKHIANFALDVGMNFLWALLILLAGIFIIKIAKRLISKSFRKLHIESSLSTFIQSFIGFLLYAILFTTVGSTLGVKTSSFVALIGAAGLAIGLALQGSLANFAGGILILIFKPFKVDDLVEVNKNLGFVVKIDILYTRLVTFDNRVITIPNGTMANSDIDNRSMQDKRRVDIHLKLAYESDIKHARKLIINTMKKHPRIFEDPEPDMWMNGFGDYAMDIAIRCWVEPDDWWPVYWEQMEAIKYALDREGISIPIPRNQVTIAREQRTE